MQFPILSSILGLLLCVQASPILPRDDPLFTGGTKPTGTNETERWMVNLYTDSGGPVPWSPILAGGLEGHCYGTNPKYRIVGFQPLPEQVCRLYDEDTCANDSAGKGLKFNFVDLWWPGGKVLGNLDLTEFPAGPWKGARSWRCEKTGDVILP